MVSGATGGEFVQTFVLAMLRTPQQWRHPTYHHCHNIAEMSCVEWRRHSNKVIAKVLNIQRRATKPILELTYDGYEKQLIWCARDPEFKNLNRTANIIFFNSECLRIYFS